MPKNEIIKFKNETDNKFRINIKIKTDMSIANIFIDTINNDFE
tara:strand:+ start:133 stop:261 length:129 start_codon:yes stop_codon:yes gene_type:complete